MAEMQQFAESDLANRDTIYACSPLTTEPHASVAFSSTRLGHHSHAVCVQLLFTLDLYEASANREWVPWIRLKSRCLVVCDITNGEQILHMLL